LHDHIDFQTKDMTYLGRNGTGKMYGMMIWSVNAESICADVPYVWIEPINSKGDVARCHMQIPMEAIPELTNKLMQFYQEMHRS
jgi:hypothetical protein